MVENKEVQIKSQKEIWGKIEELIKESEKLSPLDAIYSERGSESHHKTTALPWVLNSATDERMHSD
jgi:hypothetical protein